MKRLFRQLVIATMLSIWHVAWASPTHNIQTLTLSILSYSQFSNAPQTTLCVIENPLESIQFQKFARLYGYKYNIISINKTALPSSSCSAIYFPKNIPLVAQNNLLRGYSRHQVLSFTTNDTSCEGMHVFCLQQKNDRVTFKVNLDSLQTSKVHMDPRVLSLAQNMR